MRTFVSVALPCLLALGLVRCHGDDVGHESGLVGGSCNHHEDCEERCVEGNDYPGGTCTLDCHDDGDCPDGTWCVDRAGGICLLGCDVRDDCRNGYGCRNIDREGHSGNVTVCIDD